MTKRELIDNIARDGLVERLVANVCHRRHRSLSDLVQMVYEALLNYDEEKLMRIHRRGALHFLLYGLSRIYISHGRVPIIGRFGDSPSIATS